MQTSGHWHWWFYCFCYNYYTFRGAISLRAVRWRCTQMIVLIVHTNIIIRRTISLVWTTRVKRKDYLCILVQPPVSPLTSVSAKCTCSCNFSLCDECKMFVKKCFAFIVHASAPWNRYDKCAERRKVYSQYNTTYIPHSLHEVTIYLLRVCWF